ncbi:MULTISPECIES: hypothetical protein [Sphingomonadales]|jgi:hypothetical protein|uniref:hypothetical protein n=1 Tax=Sphingomonadales TaxID=204457 RepID=UPI00092A0CC5|nr:MULTISPECIES: hypothetical protein [Sphingomonadales]MBA4759890.1 hypothetical protein [Sphingosinicella sp.]OJY63270.1 MAG: hypothetical protein BGP16_18770 [Sphingobium sp. 66-54]|tara:strand:- start:2088 stop:2714 length:627 start_codon:yes stop_codon:yes gene_type:complete
MSSTRDALPRVFQANLGRLFERVILPVLDSLPRHATLETGVAATLDQFLDRAAAQVDNYTGNEAAKAFTLTLAGVFERQLSIWARAIHDLGLTDMSRLRGFEALLAGCAREAGIDLSVDRLGEDLTQMFVVANVVRHGEGPSCDRLRALAPELWNDAAPDYLDLLPGTPVASEHLRLRKADLVRYIRATTRFWGLADPQPLAATDPPY